MRLFPAAAVLSILTFAALPIQAQSLQPPQGPPGSLDPSFGQGGKVVTVLGQASSASSMALQSNNRIVLAGSAYTGVKNDFALARYKDNGQLDATFGTGGTVTTSIGPTLDNALGVAIDSKGRIILAGLSGNAAGYDYALAAYTTHGTLDAAFGTGGIVVTDFYGGPDFARGGLVIQSDRRPVAIGEATQFNATMLGLSRYTTSGALDATYGNGGKVTTLVFNTVGNRLFGGALQPDGKVVGTGHLADNPYTETVVGRWNADGTLDAGFGTNGTVRSIFIQDTVITSSTGYAVAIQPDGKIVIAGGTTTPNGSFKVVALSRYLANGTLDGTFGTGGQVITPAPGFVTSNQEAKSVALQADGKIVVAGYRDPGPNNGPSNILVARYNADGSLDGTFGQGGMSLLSIGTDGDTGAAVKVLSTGKILVAGGTSSEGVSGFALVRILP